MPVVAIMNEGNRFREFEVAMPNERFRKCKVVGKVVLRKGVKVAAIAVVIVDLGRERRYEELSELNDSVVGREDFCEDLHLLTEGVFRFEDFTGHEFTVRFASHKVDLSIAPFTKDSQILLVILISLRKCKPGASLGCLPIAIKSDRPDFLDRMHSWIKLGLYDFLEGIHCWMEMGLSDFFRQANVFPPIFSQAG